MKYSQLVGSENFKAVNCSIAEVTDIAEVRTVAQYRTSAIFFMIKIFDSYFYSEIRDVMF